MREGGKIGRMGMEGFRGEKFFFKGGGGGVESVEKVQAKGRTDFFLFGNFLIQRDGV